MNKKCYSCGGKLILTKDLVIKDGKTFPIQVEMCEKCGQTFSTLEETMKVKKEIHSSFFFKIKKLFCGSDNVELSWMKGKVL